MSGTKKWIASDGKTELRPGMLVLARGYVDDTEPNGCLWWVNIFSHGCDDESGRPVYCCADGAAYTQCLPLAGNKSLVGTDDPIPEPRQDAPQPDTHFEWGELVRVWDDDLDDKIGALFVRELAYTQSPYEVLEHGRAYFTQWKHCERV